MKKYIVIEGIHGSGKSSVAKALNERFQSKNIKSTYYHMPDENETLGQAIREVVADKDIVKKREITGLLYAAFSNKYHLKTKEDELIHVLDRDSVTTGLIFQRDIPWEIRLQIYKYGIENLQKNGIVVYVKANKEISLKRLTARNNTIKTEGGARTNKANDQFIAQEFDKLSDLYQTELFPQLDKLRIPYIIVENNTTIDNVVNDIEKLLK
ncbi:MAG: AAA family ATPase [Candidatus Absconditabacteria bacterium]|nr:AAA family ATPase [Candidatus Absconditabacteria bacterium]